MESPVLVEKPFDLKTQQLNSDKLKQGGFFGDSDTVDAEEQFEDPWQRIAARHPELANLRSSPWATWGARKRRGSAAGHDRPTTESSNGVRDRFFNDSFYDSIPSEFRDHLPSRWNQHFDQDSDQRFTQTVPEQEERPPQRQEYCRQSSTDKATQTPVEEASDNNSQNKSLPQYGLRNTVDLGQKTATESGQLDVESARHQRSMSAPPAGRFSSPQRSQSGGNANNISASTMANHQQQSDQDGKQPNVRVIPIFVEGRDEPVLSANNNRSSEKIPSFTEPARATPPRDDDFFMNHDIPHSFHQPHFGKPFGTSFKGFGNRTGGSGFGQNKAFQQPRNTQQEPPQQTRTFKQQTQFPTSVHETDSVPVDHFGERSRQRSPQPQQRQPQSQPQHQPQPPPQQQQQEPQEQQPQPQPQSQPQINDAISKIQLIQRDVLELMTQVENFSGKTKKDKEYIYLDEMLTRNLLKLDNIETEGKENIRLARKEAIKCIQKCIAVLEAKAESASGNTSNEIESANKSTSNVTNSTSKTELKMEIDEPKVQKNNSESKVNNETLENLSKEGKTMDDNVENGPKDEVAINDKNKEGKMDVAGDAQKSVKSIGKKKRDKSKDDRSGDQKMEVENSAERCDSKNTVNNVVDKCKPNGSIPMEVEAVASSQ